MTQRERDLAAIEAGKQKRLAKFERTRGDYEKRVEALPIELKRRIYTYRAHNPTFDVEYGAYELMCCEEAVQLAEIAKQPEIGKAMIAQGIKQPEGSTEWDTTDAVLNLRAFSAINSEINGYRYPLMKELFPAMREGHCVNSWVMSVRLACRLLTDPEMALRGEHGALATLVGCEAYGCPHEEPSSMTQLEESHE